MHIRATLNLIFLVVLSGCATRVDPSRPISRALPLSFIDLAEIREGYEQHKAITVEKKFYNKTDLNQYIQTIGYRLTSASDRPHLPYQFFVLDDDSVDVFSYGGGYIYMTRGLLEFVDSEAELAAVLAHEIAHVAAGAHSSNKPEGTGGIIFDAMRSGASAAGGAVGGPAGSVASSAFGNGMEVMIPKIKRRFEKNEEIEADKKAVQILIKANYDPRELAKFLGKISNIRVYSIVPYLNYLNSHPPYEERREELIDLLSDINFKLKQFNKNEERYIAIRFMTIHADSVPAGSMNMPAMTAAQKTPSEVSAIS